MGEKTKLNERTIRAVHAILGVLRFPEEILVVTEAEEREHVMFVALIAEHEKGYAELLAGADCKRGHVLLVTAAGKLTLRNFDKS